MKTARTILTFAVVMVVAGPVLADWNLGDDFKMHYPQLPDLEYGLDVLDGPRLIEGTLDIYSKFLADDFRCTASGPITEIHIWSSYNMDIHLPDAPPPVFNLAIYSDISDPDGPGPAYSMPGELLWHAYVPSYVERVYATAFEEFYDPNDPIGIIGFDTMVWQYNFNIPADEAFRQEVGKTYWLGVNMSADINGDGVVDIMDIVPLQQNPEWAFGWKTSQDHWNDDAVWTDVPAGLGMSGRVVGQGPWAELIDPRTGESLDLAFVIVPEPATMSVLVLGGMGVLTRRRRR